MVKTIHHKMALFFFSSRSRHTRWTGDWSSDVCSSDLEDADALLMVVAAAVEIGEVAAGLVAGDPTGPRLVLRPGEPLLELRQGGLCTGELPPLLRVPRTQLLQLGPSRRQDLRGGLRRGEGLGAAALVRCPLLDSASRRDLDGPVVLRACSEDDLVRRQPLCFRGLPGVQRRLFLLAADVARAGRRMGVVDAAARRAGASTGQLTGELTRHGADPRLSSIQMGRAQLLRLFEAGAGLGLG